MNTEYMTVQDKQKASLDILDYFHSFCMDNGITYYLAYGTLIGAVRHKGFIPWDDDVDVHLPRPDYERLLKLFYDPSGKYKLCTCRNTDEYMLPYAKIQNMDTARCLASGELDEQGIGIDLFPLDGVPDDLNKAEKIFHKENNKFIRIVQRADHYRLIKPHSVVDAAKKIYGQFFYKTGILKKTGQKISSSPYDLDYDECLYVASAIGMHSGKFRPFRKELFNVINVDFEGRSFLAPGGYDEILTIIYGDYMKLPPEDQRVTTHSDFFVWKNRD